MEDSLIGLIIFAPLLLFVLFFYAKNIKENKESEIDWKGIQEKKEAINKVKESEKVEKEVKKVIDKTNLSISKSENKSKLLNKDALRKIFNEVVKNNFNIYNINENPFKIKSINNRNTKKSYWVFLKNISPAYFANPDVSRIQIANKPIFKKIHEQKELCIPIGYDSENKTFVIWNPKLFLERILNNENISIYSRFSEQANLTESYKDFKLTNDEKVFVVQSTFLSIFLINIMSYFQIKEDDVKKSDNHFLPKSENKLFKYLGDADDLLKSVGFLKTVEMMYEKNKENEAFKDFELTDWFDLITQYKDHKNDI